MTSSQSLPSSRAAVDNPAPVVVLTSYPRPRPTTNPYIRQLTDALEATGQVEVVYFSWRAALLGRYDLVHLHWPENLVNGRTRARAAVRQVLFLLLMIRLRVTGRPIVRTRHNLELPSNLSRTQRALLRLAERRTAVVVRLNRFTPAPVTARDVLVPHGHYRDWFAAYPGEEQMPGRLLFFGLIRRYKGVGQLVRAFRDIPSTGTTCTLHVAGQPSSDELEREILDAASGDDRISVSLHFQTDADLVREITRAQLVVLPYPEMHNSGAVLAALSLGRPVLVPDNAVNQALAAEVGAEWIQTFTGELAARDLLRALEATGRRTGSGSPNLDGRQWDDAGRAHLAAYRAVLGHRDGSERS